MHTWILQTNGLADAWLDAVVRACCQGGAALLVVWLIGRIFRRLPAQAKLWLWRLAYLKLLVAFLWATPISLPVLAARRPPSITSAPATMNAADLRQEPGRSASTGVATPLAPQSTAKPVPAVGPAERPAQGRPLPSAASVLLGVWSLGVCWFALRLVKDLGQARHLRRTAQPLADQRLLRCSEELSARFGLRRAPSLRLSTAAANPLVLGIWRPMILLPAALATDASFEHLQMMLAHELAHLKRRDLWWVWPAVIGETLFFFHPAIWLAKREWRLAQEIACDHTVVRTTRAAATDYGEMLVGVTAKLHAKTRPPILATLGAVQTTETLKRRLNAMKHIATQATKRSVIAASAILVLGALNILPWRLVAQESKPAPPAPVTPAPADSAQTGPGGPADSAEARQRALPRSRAFSTGGMMPMRAGSMPDSPLRPPTPSPRPTEVAPARFEATVYEVQVPEDRVADLDAQALEAKADTAQSLAKALAAFGRVKVLYKVDQTVNLFGERITLGTSQPMITGTRMTSEGQAINSVTYQHVGLILDISATTQPPDAKRKAPDTQVAFQLAVLADSGVELAPNVKASCIRNVELSHSETPRFGKPCVQLNVVAAAGGTAALPTAYVVRYVFSAAKQ